MKRIELNSTSPVIAAARVRRLTKARRIKRKVENNYVAERPLTAGNHSGNRKGAGAARGNRNAWKHGAYTAEMRAFCAEAWRLCQSARRNLRALQGKTQ